MANEEAGFNFKTAGVTADKVDADFRKKLADWYVKAVESLYQHDEDTIWYNAEREFDKPPTLWNSYNMSMEGPYENAALNGRYNKVLGASDLSNEDLLAMFKDKSVLDVAVEDYAAYLAKKAETDDRLNAPAAPADGDGSDGKEEEEKDAAAEAAAAAKAAAERLKAAEASAAAAAQAASASSATAIADLKEQCFLLAFIHDLIAEKKNYINTTEEKPIPYYAGAGNACLMVHSEEFGFINMLTQYPSQKNLFNMTTAEISNLQPEIQLYKITSAEGSPDEQVIPIKFDSYLGSTRTAGLTDIFSNKKKRGYGAGLQDFSFTYEGSNPFAVKKSITARLVIYANTFDELSEPRGGYSYLDLALKTGGRRQRERLSKMDPKGGSREAENLAKLDFRLKAIVGWKVPPEMTGTLSSGTRDAIEESFVTLNLVPTIHNFDFDEMGRVKFEINYFAFVEDFYNRPVFSIFSSPTVMKNVAHRKLKYASIEKECSAQDLADARKADKEDIIKDKRIALNWLIDGLNKRSKVRYITIPKAMLATVASEGPYANKDQIFTKENDISTVQGSQAEALKKDVEESVDGATGADVPTHKDNPRFTKQIKGKDGNQPIIFFFVDDLLDTILDGISQTLDGMHSKWLPELKGSDSKLDSALVNEQINGYKRLADSFRKFRVLLGPVEIINPKDPSDSRFVNLGDLPISLKYFMQFLTEKTLQKDQVYYPLPSFLNDFFNIFVRTFLNDGTCFNSTPGIAQRVRINQATLTDYKTIDGDLDTISLKLARAKQKNKFKRYYDLNRDKPKGQPVLNISGFRSGKAHNAKIENDYLVYYASRAQPVRNMVGDEAEDSKAGVFHYAIGRDRGIIKNIQLTRTDIPGLKEVRAEQQGFDGLEQLREVYNADISCFANVTAYPGTYIYVDPLGFAPNMQSDIASTRAGGTPGDQFDAANLTDYGIGGYYMIIRSTHSFGPGRADTSIDARWVQEVDFERGDDGGDSDVDEEGSRPKKCTVGDSSNRSAAAAANPDVNVGGADADADADVDADLPDVDDPDTDPDM